MKPIIASKLCVLTLLALVTPPILAAGMEQRTIGTVKLDRLEIRDAAEGDLGFWEGEAWLGGDYNKVWLKSEGERLKGQTEKAEAELYWSRAIAPFWDLQLGARRDVQPDNPVRDWAAIAIQGLAPYFFETTATLYVGGEGRTNLRLESEYELLLTQRLILTPEIELNVYGKRDREHGIGDGLTDVEAGLRLRYEISRKFAPYIGVNWERLYGDTADIARAEGGDVEDAQLLVGVRAWF